MSITADGRTTVIITTHYIEEARQADAIGLMRHGTLLAEDQPDRLLERYGCSNMENVFLKLSVLQAEQAEEQPSPRQRQVSQDRRREQTKTRGETEAREAERTACPA